MGEGTGISKIFSSSLDCDNLIVIHIFKYCQYEINCMFSGRFVSVPYSRFKARRLEVCISVLTKFAASLPKEDAKDMQKINKAFTVFCKDLKLKENRFCYYLGGTDDAATGILGEMSKPLSWGMPVEKVCE